MFAASAPVFAVTDVEKSVSYYQESLGFTLTFAFGEPASYAGMVRDKVAFHLMSAELAAPRLPGHSSLYIFVKDVDEVYAEAVRFGAIVVDPIEDQTYGMRDFACIDLDGNKIAFGAETPQTDPNP